MNANEPDLLAIARLARSHPSYVAYALDQYQQDESLTDTALAEYLMCEESALIRLALCGLPRPAPQFADDVQRIAAYSGANPIRLMRLLRSVEAQRTLRGTAEGIPEAESPELPFMAARDREDAGPATDQDPEDAR